MENAGMEKKKKYGVEKGEEKEKGRDEDEDEIKD